MIKSIYDEIVTNEGLNCTNCKFAKKVDSGYECNKREFEGVPPYFVSDEKATIDCAAHSDNNTEESRYGRVNTHVFDSDDVCPICHRAIKSRTQVVIDKELGQTICVKCSMEKNNQLAEGTN